MKLEQIKKQIDKLTDEEKKELVDYINNPEASAQKEQDPDPGGGPDDDRP